NVLVKNGTMAESSTQRLPGMSVLTVSHASGVPIAVASTVTPTPTTIERHVRVQWLGSRNTPLKFATVHDAAAPGGPLWNAPQTSQPTGYSTSHSTSRISTAVVIPSAGVTPEARRRSARPGVEARTATRISPSRG